MSKLATILGIIIGSIILILSMTDHQNGEFIYTFINWQGLLLVLGGTFAAILINYPLSRVSCAFHGFIKVLSSEPHGYEDVIEEMVRLSHISKQKGLLGVEKEIDETDDRFLQFALTEMLVYHDADTLRNSLHNRLLKMRLRHLSCQEVYANMAAYAPAFGMVGTVMGLIIMMTTQIVEPSSPYGSSEGQDMLSSLLHGMGLALVTTFYGVLFANLIFMPVAGKLKVLMDAEVLRNEMIIEGAIALKNTEATLLVKEKLLAFVSEKAQKNLELLR